jgi:spore coat protein A, manganese oxidase
MQRTINRRELIGLGIFGSAALILPIERTVRTQAAIGGTPIDQTSLLANRFQLPFGHQRVLQPVHRSATTDYYEITQRTGEAQLLPGLPPTKFAGYNGQLPGPLIQVDQGREAVVRQINGLPQTHPIEGGHDWWTSTHLHGSASLPQYDGYASDITMPGEWKDYHYPNFQNARTLWYHDHGVHHTSQNAYLGLAAQYHLFDRHERELPIPKGRYDVPITISDAILGTEGQLIWNDNGTSVLMGNVVMANGVPWPVMQVERRKYRFRFLVASISRSYRLALSPSRPVQIIATDGGLVPRPQTVTEWRHGGAERYEVVIDFAQYNVGDKVVLRNLSNENNIDFASTDAVMRFDVVSEATDLSNNEVPSELFPDNDVMRLREQDARTTRTFEFGRDSGHWAVNKETWDNVISSDYRHNQGNPGLNDVELWEIKNIGGGWFHPVHIHLIDFQLISRTGGSSPGLRPEERGPKDVMYLDEGATIRLLARFGPQEGRYMMHCHNLVHEDHDMMTQFEVGSNGHDPRLAAAARALPAPPLFTPEEDRSGPGPNSGPGGGGPSAERPRDTTLHRQSTARRLRALVRSRYKRSVIRRDGFLFGVDVPPGADLLDVRLMRGDRRVHRRLVDVRPGRLQRIRLPRRLLLRRGSYRLVLRAGPSRTKLGTAVTKAFRVV